MCIRDRNQRLVYWPMLKSGDFDMMPSQFDFYNRMLKNAEPVSYTHLDVYKRQRRTYYHIRTRRRCVLSGIGGLCERI